VGTAPWLMGGVLSHNPSQRTFFTLIEQSDSC
jgi:hypothetical protein